MASPVAQPVPVPVVKSNISAATTDAQSKTTTEESEKLQKMKEIQDTVKALRKQMEDIDKKDKDDEKAEQQKKDKDDGDDDEESHALMIKEKVGLQIITDKNANQGETTNASQLGNSTAPAAKDQEKEKTDEKKAKFARFQNSLKQRQQAVKNLVEAVARGEDNRDHQF